MTTLVFLSRDDVAAVLPPLAAQIELITDVFSELASGRIELPPKPAIHPRADAFIHAMPSYVPSRDAAVVKWIAGYQSNKSRGLPYLAGLIVVNDAETGIPRAVLDAGAITKARTAAVSALCIRRWAPKGWKSAAIIGCGEQGQAHAEMLMALNPDGEVAAFDPHPERVTSLAGRVHYASSATEAARGAEVLISAAPMLDSSEPELSGASLSACRLLLPIDFDASVQAEVVAGADLFLTDDLVQFEYHRAAGRFFGWPAPMAALGDALDGESGPAHQQVVCANLGVGATDAVIADAVVQVALSSGLGSPVEL